LTPALLQSASSAGSEGERMRTALPGAEVLGCEVAAAGQTQMASRPNAACLPA